MTIRLRSALAATLMAAACKGSTEPGKTPTTTQPAVLTQLPRALTTAETNVASAANVFSFALFSTVSAALPDSNVFLSPLSASFSLGMTLNGARTGTFDAMRAALQFGGASQGDINAGYRGLIDLLGDLDPSVAFTIANSIWYRNTYQFLPAFLDSARVSFDATVTGLDFANQPASLAAINGWVNNKTNGKIPTIVDEINDDQVMFLINAIYFKGSWRTRFDPARTQPAPFTPSTGATQQAQMMSLDDTISHAMLEDGTQVADLPYGNKAYSMTVVLPPAGTKLDTYVAALTQAKWQSMIAGLHPRDIPFFMPRLTLSYERELNPDLTALGMGVAFTDLADFSGMNGTGGLLLQFVKQKTFVDINEEGTEAAAVTVTGVGITSAPMPMQVNRPYLFVIRERLTGTILFMGKINRLP